MESDCIPELIKEGKAGSEEKSDALIIAQPYKDGIRVELKSSVQKMFGEKIERSVREVLKEMGVKNALIKVRDLSAFDFVIKARVETAVLRAMGELDE